MHLEQRFPQKRAFITGAASGLGLAICKRLAPLGWRLLIADINAARLEETEETLRDLGAETRQLVLDVTDVSALEGAAEQIQQLWGGVVSLSETLKTELANDNIGVSVICPTVFVTSLGETLTGHRQMEDNLIRQLEASKVTADDIVDDMMRAIEKNRLYVITQADAKWGWRIKRFFPELYTSLISYLYSNKKWIYSE